MSQSRNSESKLQTAEPGASVVRRLGLLFLGLGSPILLFCFIVGGPTAEVVFLVLSLVFPFALVVVALPRGRPLGWLGWLLAAVVLILEGGGVGMLLLRGRVESGPWIGGLPAAAVLQLLCLWLIPLLLVGFGHALTFDRFGVDEDDLAKLDEVRSEGEEKL